MFRKPDRRERFGIVDSISSQAVLVSCTPGTFVIGLSESSGAPRMEAVE